MTQCAYCTVHFEPTTSYQIYCSVDCREKATKERSKERARTAAIKRRRKSKRMCANGCGTQLSIYNDDKICNHCKQNDRLVNLALKNIERFFKYEQH